MSTTDPSGGANTWKDAYLPGEYAAGSGLVAISCPTVKLCVAIDNSGNAFTSTDPTGGSRTWVKNMIATPIEGNFALTGLSCLPKLCIAVDDYGEEYVWADPAAVARTSDVAGMSVDQR